MEIDTLPRKVHEGRNVKRIREILGIKQEALATELGMSQQNLSNLEQRESIDPDLLSQVAKALKIPIEAIRNFTEEATFNIVSNTYNDHSSSVNYQFNPIGKIVELYESLLNAEKEKVAMLQKLLEERKGQ